MELKRLYPRPGAIAPEQLVSRLELGSRAAPERPYVVLNMVATLDGKAAVEGTTREMGGEADRLIFHHLRTQVDALLVGAGTVRTERYGRAARSDELRQKRADEGLERELLTVIVSGRLHLPADLPMLADPEARVVIATGADHRLDGVAAQVEYLRTGDDLPLLLSRLREGYGVRSVLCEGGPTLNSFLLAAGAVDELFLSTTTQIVGGAEALTIVAGRELPEPTGAELVWLYEAGGELFFRWRLRT